jgi:CRISPR system Cascade subunit CasE
MTYLSRIWLNPLRTRAQALLRNPQVVHAAVLGGIAHQPVTERVLWRLEPDGAHRAQLLVLTESAPSWEHIVEQAGWPGADEPQALVRPYQPLLDRIVRGREFAFRLKANPTTSTKQPLSPSPAQKDRLAAPRPRGVRVAHRTAAHQLTWFTDRTEAWGFTLVTDDQGTPAVRLSVRGRLEFTKRRSDGSAGQRVTLQTATYDGVLRVTDPDRARRSLLHGLGPGKAYGLGLLTLAPPASATVR